jgi:hypothetical protein
LRAANSCAWSFILLACADAEPHKRVVVPNDESDGSLAPDKKYPDSGVTATSELCRVSEEFVAEHKACTSDIECTKFEYQKTCCAETHVVGLALADLKAAQDCDDTANVVCNCGKDPSLRRTEDGRVVTEQSPAEVQCIDKQCRSRVSRRQCGASLSCSDDQICVTYQNVEGGFPPDPDSKDNKLLTFRCEPNPCAGGPLACGCAKRLCDARNDVARRCEIMNNAEVDLTCSAEPD